MRSNSMALKIGGLFLAMMLGWFLRGIFEDSVKNASRSPAQVVQHAGKTDSNLSRTPRGSASNDGSAALGAGAFWSQQVSPGREALQVAPQPEVALPPTVIPPGLRSGEIELDPSTGALRFTPREQDGAAHISPPLAVKSTDAPPAAIEMDPATGAVRFVRSPAEETALPRPKIIKTPDKNTAGNSPAGQKTGK